MCVCACVRGLAGPCRDGLDVCAPPADGLDVHVCVFVFVHAHWHAHIDTGSESSTGQSHGEPMPDDNRPFYFDCTLLFEELS